MCGCVCINILYTNLKQGVSPGAAFSDPPNMCMQAPSFPLSLLLSLSLSLLLNHSLFLYLPRCVPPLLSLCISPIPILSLSRTFASARSLHFSISVFPDSAPNSTPFVKGTDIPPLNLIFCTLCFSLHQRLSPLSLFFCLSLSFSITLSFSLSLPLSLSERKRLLQFPLSLTISLSPSFSLALSFNPLFSLSLSLSLSLYQKESVSFRSLYF